MAAASSRIRFCGAGDPSLRLKSGSARNDAALAVEAESRGGSEKADSGELTAGELTTEK